jgi:hypothetical protein
MELLGDVLLFIITACWIGFIGFLFCVICAPIIFSPVGEFIGEVLSDIARWFKENELINRYRALLRIRWLLWRANRQLERWR